MSAADYGEAVDPKPARAQDAGGQRAAAAAQKTSSGAGHVDSWEHDLDVDHDLDDDDPEADDAAYTAELIRDAARDLHRTDRMSAYERRIALREIKSVLQDAYADRDERPVNPKVREYLVKDEHTNTNDQFVVLREEMMRILKDSEEQAQRISQLCNVLRSTWRAQGYRPTTDWFELAALRGGKRLHPHPATIKVLEYLISAYMTTPDAADDMTAVGQLRLRLRDLLVACSVPEAIAVTRCQEPAEGTHLVASIARLEAALPAYREAVEGVASLQDPISTHHPSASSSSGSTGGGGGGRGRPPLEKIEDFLDRSEQVVKRIRRWQLMANAPFYVSKGEQLRFGVPVASVGGTEPFSTILQNAVKAARSSVKCRPMNWPDPEDDGC